MALIVVCRRHAFVGQVAAPSSFMVNSFVPGPLQRVRRSGPLLHGDVVCCGIPVAVDRPLNVSGNRHFHLRSCRNECSLEGGEEEDELLLLFLIHAQTLEGGEEEGELLLLLPIHAQVRRLFVSRRARTG